MRTDTNGLRILLSVTRPLALLRPFTQILLESSLHLQFPFLTLGLNDTSYCVSMLMRRHIKLGFSIKKSSKKNILTAKAHMLFAVSVVKLRCYLFILIFKIPISSLILCFIYLTRIHDSPKTTSMFPQLVSSTGKSVLCLV